VSNEQLILLLLVAVIANVVLSAAYLLAPSRATRGGDRMNGPDPDDIRPRPVRNANRFGTAARAALPGAGEPATVALQMAAEDAQIPELRAGVTVATYDRVARIVGYAFLVAVAVVVGATGLYPRTAGAIYVVLGIAGLLVLLVHDVLPSTALGPGKLILEGSGAIALVTVLLALTGGVDSPFFFGYYLILAATALVVRGRATFVVAAGISAVYAVAIVALPQPLGSEQLLRLAFNVVSLWLLAYLASVVAREQRRTRDAAVKLSLFDPLTRLHNRNYFFAAMEAEIQRAARTDRRFCLLMIDLDDLKPINDTFGHHYGDRMIRAVAESIRAGIRTIDTAARFGGDEFVVLLPETDPTGGFIVAEKIRRAISNIRLDANGQPVRTSASIGVVAYPDDGQTADQLMITADATMYESKRRGKNRVGGRAPNVRVRQAAAPSAARTGTARRPAPKKRRATPPREPPARSTRAMQERPPTRERWAAAQPAPSNVPAAVDQRAPAARDAQEARTTEERPAASTRPASRRGRRIPGTKRADAEGGGPRATRRFQVLGADEDEQIGRIMGHLLGGPPAPRPIRPADAAPPDEADNRPA
jgi:diguanylate cyclase (GGDEF)-like protein